MRSFDLNSTSISEYWTPHIRIVPLTGFSLGTIPKKNAFSVKSVLAGLLTDVVREVCLSVTALIHPTGAGYEKVGGGWGGGDSLPDFAV